MTVWILSYQLSIRNCIESFLQATTASAADEAKHGSHSSPSVGDAAPRNIIPTPMKIGFLGLGIMGSGMVFNLLKSGHEVTVWNRTSAKVR